MITFSGLIIFALFSFLSLLFCASPKLDNIPITTQNCIAEYLEYPLVTLGSINRKTHNSLTMNFPLKQIVSQRFNIIFPATVSDNERELQYLLSLSIFAKNPKLVFQALAEDVFNLKLPYNRLYRLFNVLLFKVFKDPSLRIQGFYFNDDMDSFKDILRRYYLNRGDSKTKVDTIMDKPDEIFSWFFDSRSYHKLNFMIEELLREKYGQHTILMETKNNMERLKNSSNELIVDFHSNENEFIKIVRYYAIKSIKIINNDRLVIDIFAPESTLALGFPLFHRFSLIIRPSIFDSTGYLQNIISIWTRMKILNEATFYSFLCDFEKIYIPSNYKNNVETSFEVIKFVLSSPRIIEKIKSIGIRLSFMSVQFDVILFNYLMEILDMIENTEELCQIFNLKIFFLPEYVTRLRTMKQIKKFEEISGSTVSEIFLKRDNGKMTEIDYFRWRLIFNYWIGSDQKYRIREIKSQMIIKLLRIEFYDDMIELFGREIIEDSS